MKRKCSVKIDTVCLRKYKNAFSIRHFYLNLGRVNETAIKIVSHIKALKKTKKRQNFFEQAISVAKT